MRKTLLLNPAFSLCITFLSPVLPPHLRHATNQIGEESGLVNQSPDAPRRAEELKRQKACYAEFEKAVAAEPFDAGFGEPTFSLETRLEPQRRAFQWKELLWFYPTEFG